MLNIEIDGRRIEVDEGSMVIEAADAAGIYIPRFCYHPKLSVAANCRMCLVDIERVAKPVPACATPVTEGMRVFTRSEKTVTAQRGVMEFLLINHPLDCPICDQGGECQLQDLAVGYGKDVSRYTEAKRIVKDEDLGPLIATDMTRCIHCTRCVRFGQEIAGIMELGATGRGEHMRIGTYLGSGVASELSGNMIDLCPVGALTSKPFRYSARPWELQDHPSVSPHDCVGSNLTVQVERNAVRRVLPRENEDVNEVWLSDRDRFSYTALNSPARLRVPRIKVEGAWRDTDWATAIEFTVRRLTELKGAHGGELLGAAAGPQCTTEEFYLLQRLVRGLGSGTVDHRLRQRDFSGDAVAPPFPSLGCTLRELEDLEAVLLVGSNVRKDQPLIAHRLRKAFLAGARISAINSIDYDFTFDLSGKSIGPPEQMLDSLVAVLKELNRLTGVPVPPWLKEWAVAIEPSEGDVRIAEMFAHTRGRRMILLGNAAFAHPRFSALRTLAECLAKAVRASVGYLVQGNGAGAWVAGCVPHRGAGGVATLVGLDAYEMWAQPRKGYLLLGTEPELDAWDGGLAARALEHAELVVSLTPFANAGERYAHVQLPMGAFTETDGTLINCMGQWQSFAPAVSPPGEARPGWKILRALGGALKVHGFTFTSIDEVRSDIRRGAPEGAIERESFMPVNRTEAGERDAESLLRLMEVPIYASDMIVRRAPPLQASADNPPPAVHVNPEDAARLGIAAADVVTVSARAASTVLPLVIDGRVPSGCALIPAGYYETSALAPFEALRIERAS
ncbi:MAG: NADH-quinone oxidoreductase subunit NuoG [Acidiferrobacteraceae bacterium]